MDLIIGSHVEVSGNEMLFGAVKKAISYGANTFMFYTGAPQNSYRKPISTFKKDEAYALMVENKIDVKNVVVHAPYIINIANSINEETYNIGIVFLKQELKRVSELGFKILVLHPGSHVNAGDEVGLNRVINGLNEVLNEDDSDVKIAIETMAGKGSEIGYSFEQINRIISNIDKKERIGVCLDTCHIFDAGYDIVNNYEEVIAKFEHIIGIEKLLTIHVNDSKNTLGTKKDRHENIGYGNIGFETLLKFIYDSRFVNIPKILETPYINDLPPYHDEIVMIKKKEFNNSIKTIENKEKSS